MSKTVERLEELGKIMSYINVLRDELHKNNRPNNHHFDIVCRAENYILEEILKEVKEYCSKKEVTT